MMIFYDDFLWFHSSEWKTFHSQLLSARSYIIKNTAETTSDNRKQLDVESVWGVGNQCKKSKLVQLLVNFGFDECADNIVDDCTSLHLSCCEPLRIFEIAAVTVFIFFLWKALKSGNRVVPPVVNTTGLADYAGYNVFGKYFKLVHMFYHFANRHRYAVCSSKLILFIPQPPPFTALF